MQMEKKQITSLRTWRRGVASSVSVDDEDAGGGAEIGGTPLERRPVGRSPGADRTRPAGGSSL
jgi:hypothetical protein